MLGGGNLPHWGVEAGETGHMALRVDDVDLQRDRALVHAHQSGDAAAFDDLYRRYFARLYRFCLKRTGDAYEAEEIAQEAFARAYRAMPSFAGERRFYPWLTVIASRLCVDAHRRNARTEPSADVDPGSVNGSDDAVFMAADIELLDLALKRLHPRHREVLALREQHGWSYKAIAEHYAVSLATVEMLIFRARQALKREFLSMAGPDARLAGIPAIAWLARRGVALRSRIAELAPALAGPVLAPTFSALLVAGSAAIFAGGGGMPSTAVASSSPPAASRIETPVADAPLASAGAHAPSPAAGGPAASTQEPVLRAKLAAELGKGDRGRRYAGEAPVGGDAGAAAIGADPAQVVDDTVGAVTSYTDQVTGASR